MCVLCFQARKQPTSQAGVIEYLLSTETGEMQYETARCRPQLDASFFTYLDRQVGGCMHERDRILAFVPWPSLQPCLLYITMRLALHMRHLSVCCVLACVITVELSSCLCKLASPFASLALLSVAKL